MKKTGIGTWTRVLLFSLLFSCFTSISAYAGGWELDQIGWWDQEDDGSYPRNGWREIHGNWFYFYDSGYIAQNTITPDGYYVDSNGCYIDLSQKYSVVNQVYGFETIELEVGQHSGDGRVYVAVLIDGRESWYGEESAVFACGGQGVELHFSGIQGYDGQTLTLSWIVDDPTYGVYVKGGGLPEAQYDYVRPLSGN